VFGACALHLPQPFVGDDQEVLGLDLFARDALRSSSRQISMSRSSSRTARADHQWAVLWALAIKTGPREGELLALQWTDIDMDHGLVGVTRNS